MSFYRRYGGFGASAAVQTLDAALVEANARLNAATDAATLTAERVIALDQQMKSAKALHAQLSLMDSDWFKRVSVSSDNSGSDWAMYQKYVGTFPIDSRIQSGPMWNFDAPNELLEQDQQHAWDQWQQAEDALPQAKANNAVTKKALVAAVDAKAALDKKYAAAVKAEQKAAADTAAAKAAALVAATTPRQPSAPSKVPLAIVGGVVALGLAAMVLARKKPTAVAGYRRRSRR